MNLLFPKNRTSEIAAILPNYGYFGSSDWNALHVKIATDVEELIIFSPSDEKEHFNLWSLYLFREQRDVTKQLFSQAQCDLSGNDRVWPGASLLQGRGMHSDYLPAVHWRARFDPPQRIDSIVVRNRSDFYGGRSKNLQIATRRGDEISIVHDPLSISRFSWLLNWIDRILVAGTVQFGGRGLRKALMSLAIELVDDGGN